MHREGFARERGERRLGDERGVRRAAKIRDRAEDLELRGIEAAGGQRAPRVARRAVEQDLGGALLVRATVVLDECAQDVGVLRPLRRARSKVASARFRSLPICSNTAASASMRSRFCVGDFARSRSSV